MIRQSPSFPKSFTKPLAAFVCAGLLIALAAPALAAPPKSEDEKTLYFLGVAVARNLRDFALTDDELKWVMQGIEQSIKGKEVKLDPQVYGKALQTMRTERRQKVLAMEKTESEAFVTAAASKKGAKKMESGLVYTEIKAGSGPSPSPTDKVKVHYHGTLRDGTVFDSSVERDVPAEFPLNRVIPCWTEGVGMMKVGGKAKFVCPAPIAYGDRGAPPSIPGGAALTFEVELLEIVSE